MSRPLQRLTMAILAAAAALPLAAQAAPPTPHAGPVFTDFGRIFTVDSDVPIPKDTIFKIRFDVYEAAEIGKINRKFDSAGRFINMNVEAGIPEKNIHIALVVHGRATIDLLNDAAYGQHNDGKPNGSAAVLKQLMDHGVQVYLCGQSAGGNGVAKADLIPGVKLGLSAMDLHALLGQQGFILIP